MFTQSREIQLGLIQLQNSIISLELHLPLSEEACPHGMYQSCGCDVSEGSIKLKNHLVMIEQNVQFLVTSRTGICNRPIIHHQEGDYRIEGGTSKLISNS